MLHITLITSSYKMFTAMLDRACAQPHVTFRPRPASQEPESEPDLKHTEPIPPADTDIDIKCTQPSSPSSPLCPPRTVSSIMPDSPDVKEVILDLISGPAQATTASQEDPASDASLPLESQSSILPSGETPADVLTETENLLASCVPPPATAAQVGRPHQKWQRPRGIILCVLVLYSLVTLSTLTITSRNTPCLIKNNLKNLINGVLLAG